MRSKFLQKTQKHIRLATEKPVYRDILDSLRKKPKGRRAVLFGTPSDGNAGAHFAVRETLKYLRSVPFDEIIEVPEKIYRSYPEEITIREDDVLFVFCEGRIGTNCPSEEITEKILENYRENLIVLLPQTIQVFGRVRNANVRAFADRFYDTPYAVLCLRERKSYYGCLNDLGLPEERLLLLPDMSMLALSDVHIAKKRDRKQILFSFRKTEKHQPGMKQALKDLRQLEKNGFSLLWTEMDPKKKIIPPNRREKYIEEKIEEYSSANMVITDDLHAMIFALSTGTKCIAVDDATNTIVGIYRKWLAGMPGLVVLNTPKQLTADLVAKQMELQERPFPMDLMVKMRPLTKLLHED